MASVQLDGARIRDWATFHTLCAATFGFPGFYGRNMNAWIDCLTYLRDGDGMSRFELAADEVLRIEVRNSADLQRRLPELTEVLVESVEAVNQRQLEIGQPPVLDLAFG